MENILKYKNRNKLYQFLIDDYHMIKIAERYDPKNFGNYCITLSSNDFLLSYVNDRSFLDIYFESKLEPNKGFPLSFLKNYIHRQTYLNDDCSLNNEHRIEILNNFLKVDFYKLSEFVNEDNYFNTKKRIDELLKEQFIKKFPNAVK